MDCRRTMILDMRHMKGAVDHSTEEIMTASNVMECEPVAPEECFDIFEGPVRSAPSHYTFARFAMPIL